MGDGSSKIPMFSGQGFMDWSKKMKKHLISEGLWSWVEKGLKKAKTPEEMKQETMNDANALSIIRESLSPDIFIAVVHATTAKEAWDTLHRIFMKKKKNKAMHSSNDGASTNPMIEPSHGLGDRSKMKELSVDESTGDRSNIGDDDGVMPLSGDKPFFDMVLTHSAVKPRYHITFPSRLDSILPSNNVQALVRFFGQVYEVQFYGARKQKSFGSGWRQLVEDHNLEEGDFLVFELITSDEYNLEINLQVLRCKLPPELEQEIEMRKLPNKPKVIIDLDDYNTSDEDE